MKITKNGFYKLSDIYSEKIIIENDLIISIFDDIGKNLDLELGENSKLEFFGLIENSENFELNIIQNKKNSSLKLNYLVLSKDKDEVRAKINSVLSANYTKSQVSLLSIVGENGKIDLDGIINIEENVEKVVGHLLEENIFLGESGKIKAIPTLLVKSSDVEASHACKIERISDENLFYLRSRGIGKDNALNIMIEAKISDLFSCLKMYDNIFYDKVLDEILKKI